MKKSTVKGLAVLAKVGSVGAYIESCHRGGQLIGFVAKQVIPKITAMPDSRKKTLTIVGCTISIIAAIYTVVAGLLAGLYKIWQKIDDAEVNWLTHQNYFDDETSKKVL